jgi:hypothetical protein
MSYTEGNPLVGTMIPNGAGVLAADDLSATGVHGEYVACMKVRITHLFAAVTTLMDGAATVEVNRRPTLGSATGEVAIDNIVIPTTTAVGKVVYVELASPVVLNAGDALSFEVTSAATAGGAIYGFRAVPDFEYLPNEGDLVLSA